MKLPRPFRRMAFVRYHRLWIRTSFRIDKTLVTNMFVNVLKNSIKQSLEPAQRTSLTGAKHGFRELVRNVLLRTQFSGPSSRSNSQYHHTLEPLKTLLSTLLGGHSSSSIAQLKLCRLSLPDRPNKALACRWWSRQSHTTLALPLLQHFYSPSRCSLGDGSNRVSTRRTFFDEEFGSHDVGRQVSKNLENARVASPPIGRYGAF